MESENITGSMKIRSAKKILNSMDLKAGDTVIESTSGNMGVALAWLSLVRVLNCVLVVDPKLSPWHREHVQEFGARLVEVEEVDDTGGWLKTRLKKVNELLEVRPDWHWVDQYANPNNPWAFEDVGREIAGQLFHYRESFLHHNVWFFASGRRVVH
jgi:cysteine synthase A